MRWAERETKVSQARINLPLRRLSWFALEVDCQEPEVGNTIPTEVV